jgi:tetratricopeptide (TPR) repeat protein
MLKVKAHRPMASPIKRVLAGRYDRLGARLASMIRGLEIARSQGADYGFFWRTNPLFENETNDVSAVFSDDFIRQYHVNDEEEWKRFVINDDIFQNKSADGQIEYFVSNPFLDPNRPHAADSDNLPEDLGIKFHTSVQSRIDALAQEFGDFVALHIRRGDVVSGINSGMFEYRTRYAPLEFYIDYVEQNPTTKFMVFSDDFDLAASSFPAGSQVSCFNELSISNEITGIQRDLLELLLLGRLKHSVGAHSAFRKTAASLFNRETSDIHDELDKSSQKRVLQEKINDLPSDSVEKVPCIFKLCDHLEEERQDDLLREYLFELNRRFFSNPKFLNHAGHVFWRIGDNVSASRMFRESINVLEHDYSLCKFGQARVQYSTGNLDRSVRLATEATAHGKNRSAKIASFAAALLNKSRDFEQSVEVAMNALPIHEHNADIHYQLSIALDGLSRGDEAKHHASRAAEIKPSSGLYVNWAKKAGSKK